MSGYRIWLTGPGEYVEVQADTPRQALLQARALQPSRPITGINQRKETR